MKHSKPVICSDFGGMKEVVNNDITGLVVPNGDVLALAQGLRKLLKNKKMRIAMGKAGYKRLANLFRAEQMAREYDKIIL